MNLDLDLGSTPRRTIDTKTPQETKVITKCHITYEDGTELILQVDDANGFHRVSSALSVSNMGFINHEIFIAYPTGN